MKLNKLKEISFYILFITGFSIFFSSCGDEECLMTSTSEVLIQLKSTSTKKDTTIVFSKVHIVGASDWRPVAGDEPFNLGRFGLPVNPGANTTTYIFTRLDEDDTPVVNSLTISYTINPQILSSDCELEQRYMNLKIEESPLTTFPELILKKNELTISEDPNVQIFF